MFDLPPAAQYLWLQSTLWGLAIGLLWSGKSPVTSALVSLTFATTCTWFNAALCGTLLSESGIVHGFWRGFGGFGIVLPPLLPSLVFAPVACLAAEGVARLFVLEPRFEKPRSPINLKSAFALAAIPAVGIWQLVVFVRHAAF